MSKKLIIIITAAILAVAGGTVGIIAATNNKTPEPTYYTVTFNTNGGSEVASESVKEGDQLGTPQETGKSGYDFDGWYLDSGFNNPATFPLTVNENLTLYAKWKDNNAPKTYTVTFETNGGSAISPVQVEEGGKISTPSETTQDGYDFDGWYLDSGFERAASFPLTVNENLTLYAKWEVKVVEPETATVTFNTNGGTAIPSQTVEKGTSINAPADPENGGLTFDGWYLDAGFETKADFPLSVDRNLTLYAKWSGSVVTPQNVTITFNSMGGSAVTSITVQSGTQLTALPTPTYENKRFVGWCYDEDLQNAVTLPITVARDITLYASYNDVVDIVALLEELLGGYELDPYSYIPLTMRPAYSGNLIPNNYTAPDYSNFVNVSNILDGGFGEQWNMITDNLNQSQRFFDVLKVVETISTSAISAFNNYFDQNPSDTAHHTFAQGIYNVTVDFDGKILYFVLDYTAEVFGSQQTVQIALKMNTETSVKSVRLQIGDANALKYEIKPNSYTFAIRYLGVRRAYFNISRGDNGVVSGNICEHLVVENVGITSAADFYITDTYVTCVGNKASGIPGFSGYICELYNVQSGKLLGYEVRENLSSLVTFNTLWFKLADVSGLTSIKYREKTDTEEAAFFVNGRTTEWQVKEVGGLSGKSFSRRFDIEFRTQYYYSYDEQTETYTEYKVSVPMMFIQEENFETFTRDVKEKNSGLTLSISISQTYLNKLMNDYDSLVDVFIANKDAMTPESILNYIGEKVTFA